MGALSKEQTLRTAKGFGFDIKIDFIKIGQISPSLELYDTYQFRFNEKHQLILARHIDKIVYIHRQWQAKNLKETYFTEEHTTTKEFKTAPGM